MAARQANPEMVRFVLGLTPGREERKRALAWTEDADVARLLAIYGATFKDEAEQEWAIEVAGYTLKPYIAIIVANLTGRQELVCPALERSTRHMLNSGEGIPLEFHHTFCQQ